MVVAKRRGMGLCLLQSGFVLWIMGTISHAQTPEGTRPAPPALAGPQQPAPPPPPEPQVPASADRANPSVEALPATPGETAEADENREPARVVPRSTPAPAARVYVLHEPPPPIAERPARKRPDRRAVWTPGYWEWETARSRFIWTPGSWRIPPAGMVWAAGRWRHDERGWYWVAGSWIRPTDKKVVVRNRPAWQITGPPAEHPDDTPPPAPGPGFFYIAGHYTPDASGNSLAWVPGFWTADQPGWDWVPARWLRRPDGWEFRDGRWMRDLGRIRGNADVRVTARDPITGAGVDVEVAGEPAPVVGVVTGVPYYVIRPPGAYPYGPGGVVVPGTVPPFVRRILDQVLP
jgi:WXXGXW repeat (2 copies)